MVRRPGWLSPASGVLTRRSGGLRRGGRGRNVYLNTTAAPARTAASDCERRGLEREEPHFRASPRVARDTHGSARRMNDERVGRALGDGRPTYRAGSGRRRTGSSASSAARRTHKTHGAGGLGSERWHSGSVWRSACLPVKTPPLVALPPAAGRRPGCFASWGCVLLLWWWWFAGAQVFKKPCTRPCTRPALALHSPCTRPWTSP